MNCNTNEIAHEFLPYFRVYKDGQVERFHATETVPPSTDPQTGVQSKDTIFSQQNNLFARIFLPKLIINPNQKLPLLIHIHGGAFCISSPNTPFNHNYLNSLVYNANVIAVAVQYRRAPEHPLPAAYNDAWEAIKWVASHVNKDGPEPWLNNHADFERVFLSGDSAGANIAHNTAMKAGVEQSLDVGVIRLVGMVLIHPFFRNDEPDKLIEFIFPSISGCNDPRMNPSTGAVEEMARLGCTRVLICVAGKDRLKDRGLSYYEALKKSEWSGEVEIVETEDEDHVFHLFKPDSEKARDLMAQVVMFLNRL